TRAKSVDVLSGDQFREAMQQYWGDVPQAIALVGQDNTDWQDQIFRTSVSTDHNVSVSGAGRNLPYRVSVGFTADNGILKTSHMDRTTLSVALTPTFFDQHLRVNLNAKGMYIKNRFADQGSIGAAVVFDPTQPVYSDNFGSGIGNGYFSWLKPSGSDFLFNDIATINPLALLEQRKDVSEAYRSLGNAQFDYKFHFLPDLKANLNLGYDVSKSDGSVNIFENSPLSYKENNKNGTGQRNRYDQYKYNLLLDFFLNYNKEFKSIMSRLDVMAGYSWQHFYRKENSKTTTYLGEETYSSDFKTENYLVSFFGRLNYTFMDRYLLTFTLRNDNSSRFSKDNRSGVFPSVALAWKLTEEPWLRDQDIVSDLKFRAGYGITGQQDIYSDYPYLARYTAELGYALYPMGGVGYVPPLRPEGYDSNIKWEETKTFNIGFDYGFFDQRISGTFDYYYRDTKDLLNKIPVPAGSNLTNEIITNVGSMTNRGVEFSINTRPIVSKDWNWDLGFNVTYNENKITKLNLSSDPNYYVATGGISGPTGQTVQAHKVGYPAYSFYVYEQVYDQDGKPLEGVYVDRNRDGVVNEADKFIMHNPAPKVTMGLTSKLLYKNWDFSFSLRANVGNYVYDNLEAGNTNTFGFYNSSQYLNNMLARGTYFNNPQYLSSYYVRNASFVRCDNITLGYSFENLTRAISNLRVYSTVQNPFVITKYSGLDPEVYGGIDNNVYPRPISVMVGASISF
ncbi:MAG: SusC/RagA family TonB-linked outer membrane protein, partial [Bacteroidales bacterium]